MNASKRTTTTGVNVKAVLILAVTCAALGAGVHFAHGYQVKRNAHGLLDDADRAEQQGQVAQAADLLSQYIQLAPDDADARARFALLLSRTAEKPKQMVRAYLALGNALLRDPGRADVLRESARPAGSLIHGPVDGVWFVGCG